MLDSAQLLMPRLAALWQEALHLWASGGWAMVGIGAIALLMFTVGLRVHLRLGTKGFSAVPEHVWRRWIDQPAERSGPIGELLDHVTGGETVAEAALRFRQLRETETVPFERDLRVMRICVSAAPLVGLHGTVTGMLTTFAALATGSGGEKTLGLVAAGISEALITTETGLVVALPGLLFQYQLVRKKERYKAFLAHMETVYTQALHHRLRRLEQARAQRVALQRIARTLQQSSAS